MAERSHGDAGVHIESCAATALAVTANGGPAGIQPGAGIAVARAIVGGVGAHTGAAAIARTPAVLGGGRIQPVAVAKTQTITVDGGRGVHTGDTGAGDARTITTLGGGGVHAAAGITRAVAVLGSAGVDAVSAGTTDPFAIKSGTRVHPVPVRIVAPTVDGRLGVHAGAGAARTFPITVVGGQGFDPVTPTVESCRVGNGMGVYAIASDRVNHAGLHHG